MKVTIERLGHLGDGIAPGPIYVPLSLPGEEVEGEQIDGRIPAPRILTPSINRVHPPCQHFKTCGGCVVQHAADRFVSDWKRRMLGQVLAANGLNTEILPMITSPSGTRRRATLSARRTKKGALIGFHGRASNIIIPVPGCRLLHPDLMKALPALKDLARAGASRRGEIGFVVTQTQNGTDVVATGGKPLDRDLRADLAGLATQLGLARLVWDDEIIATLAPPAVTFGNAVVPLPPGAFLQATKEGENALISAVLETMKGKTRVVDLFSGCGTFTLPLAQDGEVHAVEAKPDMLAALTAGWRKTQGLKRVTTEARDLFRRPLLPDELAPYDGAVIDPPRAGAHAQVKELAQARLSAIAMVSCNPASFARDARILVDAGYTLNHVQPVDQFRWSAHLEISAGFTLS